MITADHPLIQLLALIDMVWVETEPPGLKRGAPKLYSEKVMFKVYVVSLLKKLWARRSLWRYLAGTPLVAASCGLGRIPDRRTLDRRLREIGPEAEAQIQALGLALSIEAVSDATMAASDGSAFKTAGPVWHKKDKPSALSLRACMAWTRKRTGSNRTTTVGSTATKRMYPLASRQLRYGLFWTQP